MRNVHQRLRILRVSVQFLALSGEVEGCMRTTSVGVESEILSSYPVFQFALCFMLAAKDVSSQLPAVASVPTCCCSS